MTGRPLEVRLNGESTYFLLKRQCCKICPQQQKKVPFAIDLSPISFQTISTTKKQQARDKIK